MTLHKSTLARTMLILLSASIALAATASLRAQEQASNSSAPSPVNCTTTGSPCPPGHYIRQPITDLPKGVQQPKMRVVELPTAGTYQITFVTGDEVIAGLTYFAEQHHITSAYVTGIGGLISAKLGFGGLTEGKDKTPVMKENDVDRRCELISLMGNISLVGGRPWVHVHAMVAFPDSSVEGGHVIAAQARIVQIFVVTTGAPPPATGPSTGG